MPKSLKEDAMQDNPNESELAELKREVAELKGATQELKASVTDLVDAWRAAKGFLAVVKWMAAIGSGLAIIWTSFHGGNQK